MKDMNKRMPKLLASVAALLLILSMVILPTMALSLPDSVPTPSTRAFTTKYENGVYTLDLDAAFIGDTLKNSNYDLQSLKGLIPDSVYQVIADRDPAAAKALLVNLVARVVRDYIGEDRIKEMITGVVNRSYNATLPAGFDVNALLSGNFDPNELLNQIPDDFTVTTENLDQIMGTVNDMVSSGVITTEQIDKIVDVDVLWTELEIKDANGNPAQAPTVEELLSGAHNDAIVSAPKKDQLGAIVKNDKVVSKTELAKVEISLVDMLPALLNNFKDEVYAFANKLLDALNDVMGIEVSFRGESYMLYVDSKFDVAEIETAVLAFIPTLDELSEELGSEGAAAELLGVRVNIITKNNTELVDHVFGLDINLAGSTDDRAIFKKAVDLVARAGSYDFDPATGAIELGLRMPDGVLEAAISVLDGSKLPADLRAKLGTAADLDFSDSANYPAILNAIIKNLSLMDLAELLEGVSGADINADLLAKFHLTAARVDTAVDYYVRAINKFYDLADQYGKVDFIRDVLENKSLAAVAYEGNGVFAYEISGDVDVIAATERMIAAVKNALADIDSIPEQDRYDAVVSRLNRIDRLPASIKNYITSAFAAGNARVDSVMSLLNRVNGVPEIVTDFLANTTIAHDVRLSLEIVGLYKVDYVNGGEIIDEYSMYISEGYAIDHPVDAAIAPNGWALADGTTPATMGSADITLAPVRKATLNAFLVDVNGVKTPYTLDVTELVYNELGTLPTLPTLATEYGYNDFVWDIDTLPLDKDVTATATADIKVIAISSTVTVNGVDYLVEFEYTFLDDVYEILNNLAVVKEIYAANPLYTFEWYAVTADSRILIDDSFVAPLEAFQLEVEYDGVLYDIIFQHEDGTQIGEIEAYSIVNALDKDGKFNLAILCDYILSLAPTDEVEKKLGYTIGWTIPPIDEDDLGDIIVTVYYTADEYDITFVDEDGKTLGTGVYTIENALKDGKFDYETLKAYILSKTPEVEVASGYAAVWTVPAITEELGDIIVTVHYTADAYDITFVDEDGEILGTATYTIENALKDGAFDYETLKAYILSKTPAVEVAPGYEAVWTVPAITEELGDVEVTVTLAVATMTQSFTITINGVTYTIEFSYTINDNLLDILNGLDVTRQILRNNPGYRILWYASPISKARALTEKTLITEDFEIPATPFEISAELEAIEYNVIFQSEFGTQVGEAKTYTVENAFADPAKKIFDAEILKAYILSIAPTDDESIQKPGYTVGWNVPTVTVAGLGDIIVTVEYTEIPVEETTEPETQAPTETDTQAPTETDTQAPTETDPPVIDTQAPTQDDTAAPTEPETEDDDEDKAGFPWWILLIILAVIIIVIVVIIILRRRNDDEEPTDEEPTDEDVPAEEPEAEGETEEEAPLFIPVGEEIPEEEIPDEIEVVEEVSAETVDELMTDKVAEHFLESTAEMGGTGKMGIINVGQLGEVYAAGDVIDLADLQAKGLVEDNIGRLKVLAAGTLDKALTVKADAFSVQAIKMITLTGGHAIKLGGDVAAEAEEAPVEEIPAEEAPAVEEEAPVEETPAEEEAPAAEGEETQE